MASRMLAASKALLLKTTKSDSVGKSASGALSRGQPDGQGVSVSSTAPGKSGAAEATGGVSTGNSLTSHALMS
jgi:hypothetical protein